jgi:hypothetical protein
VPLYTAECRFIRGILVGTAIGPRTCGFLVGHLQALAGARFAADRWNSLSAATRHHCTEVTQRPSPAARLAIGDKDGTVCMAQSNRIHLSPCRQFAANRRLGRPTYYETCTGGWAQIIQLSCLTQGYHRGNLASAVMFYEMAKLNR